MKQVKLNGLDFELYFPKKLSKEKLFDLKVFLKDMPDYLAYAPYFVGGAGLVSTVYNPNVFVASLSAACLLAGIFVMSKHQKYNDTDKEENQFYLHKTKYEANDIILHSLKRILSLETKKNNAKDFNQYQSFENRQKAILSNLGEYLQNTLDETDEILNNVNQYEKYVLDYAESNNINIRNDEEFKKQFRTHIIKPREIFTSIKNELTDFIFENSELFLESNAMSMINMFKIINEEMINKEIDVIYDDKFSIDEKQEHIEFDDAVEKN